MSHDHMLDAAGAHKHRRSSQRGRGSRRVFLAVLLAVLALGTCGAVLIRSGITVRPAAAAPLPTRTFDVPASELPSITVPPAPKQVNAPSPAPVTDPAGGCQAHLSPGHLVIPSLCVDAPLVSMGDDRAGDPEIPADVHHVGVWSHGAPLSSRTGQHLAAGTTLLAGHVDYVGQGAGALYTLHDIAPGALVYVADARGQVTTWRITALAVVLKSRLPSWLFDGSGGPRRLALITCGGPIVHIPGYGASYRDNVIATAVPA